MGQIIGNIIGLLRFATLIIIGLATVFFLYGLLKYLLSSNSDKKSEAIKTIVNGIIILFVMISVWALVGVIGATFNIGQAEAPINQYLDPTYLIR